MQSTDEGQQSDGTSFEDAFTRLGEVVQGLESGGLTIEQATRLYEEGMELARRCNQLLNQTELRVTELRSAYDDFLTGQTEEPDE